MLNTFVNKYDNVYFINLHDYFCDNDYYNDIIILNNIKELAKIDMNYYHLSHTESVILLKNTF